KSVPPYHVSRCSSFVVNSSGRGTVGSASVTCLSTTRTSADVSTPKQSGSSTNSRPVYARKPGPPPVYGEVRQRSGTRIARPAAPSARRTVVNDLGALAGRAAVGGVAECRRHDHRSDRQRKHSHPHEPRPPHGPIVACRSLTAGVAAVRVGERRSSHGRLLDY